MATREAYTIPDTDAASAAAGAAAGQPFTQATTEGVTFNYLCGNCNAKVPLKRGDPIRCKECGHRILYKERTKRMVQFEAR